MPNKSYVAKVNTPEQAGKLVQDLLKMGACVITAENEHSFSSEGQGQYAVSTEAYTRAPLPRSVLPKAAAGQQEQLRWELTEPARVLGKLP